MARKSDDFYFENFKTCSRHISDAARLLSDVMNDFDPDRLEERIDEMHAIEQAGDELRHELLDALVTAFITPIEREDLASLSASLDDVIDCIEGVLHRLYYNNVREVTAGALEMVSMLVKCTDEMGKLLDELPQFKKSKALHEHVVSINTVEEMADEVFVRVMRELHTSERDALRLIGIRETYQYLEYCVDACEHVGDLVDGIVMKNS